MLVVHHFDEKSRALLVTWSQPLTRVKWLLEVHVGSSANAITQHPKVVTNGVGPPPPPQHPLHYNTHHESTENVGIPSNRGP